MTPITIDLSRIKELSWTTKTTFTPSSIITYNIALGAPGTDLSLCYEGHPSFHALPTFATIPVISIMGPVTRSMASFLPRFKPHNHVHGEHYLETYAPFPPEGGTLETTAQIVDIVDKGKGVTVLVGILTHDEKTGKKICYNEWTSFIIGVPGAGASQALSSARRATSSSPPPRPPDRVVEHKTSPEQAALYRAASGDLNALHIDPAVAKAGGFSGPLLTGTCTLGMGVRHVIDSFCDNSGGEGWKRFKSVRVRLSAPVFPGLGEEVRTEMWEVGEEEGRKKIQYRQAVGAGKNERVVMRDGAVELDVGVAGDGSKL